MSSTVKYFQIFFSLKRKINISFKLEILPYIDLFEKTLYALSSNLFIWMLLEFCKGFLNYLFEELFLLNFFCNLAVACQKSLIWIQLHQLQKFKVFDLVLYHVKQKILTSPTAPPSLTSWFNADSLYLI